MKVRVYAVSTCPVCRRLRGVLNDLGIEYEWLDVDKAPREEALAALDYVERVAGAAAFPVVVAGDEVIVGLDEGRLRELVEQGGGPEVAGGRGQG